MERHFCLDDSPRFRMIELDEVDSTNNFVKFFAAPGDSRMMLVTAEYQTAGRGSDTNKWESEKGKNLLFSIQCFPHDLLASKMFSLSEITALAISTALGEYADGFSIKWPNDIYFGDNKVVGMLVENDLSGKLVQRSVIGVGVNVNQTTFLSDAPNPLSLAQILGHDVERRFVLEKIMEHFTRYLAMLDRGESEEIHAAYLQRLYRKGMEAEYCDAGGHFVATLCDVQPSGHLLLQTADGEQRRYEFKEVKFVI